MELLGNIKSSIVNTFSTSSPPSAISRSEILGLEETERSRRLEQVSQSRVDKQNAANVSTLIKGQSFPVFKGNVSRGYKRVTTKFEDEERRRRLTNKSESALRRTNANKTARMISSMGWPFYQQNHSGAQYIQMDPTKLLEEEEREWRTTDSYWTPTARHNAATVANILRWNNFQRNPRTGFRRHLRYVEEKERRDRLNADNMTNAMQNSYNEARLIRQKGAPFFVQEAVFEKRDFSQVHKLEEAERKRRIANPGEKQLARELAGIVGGHLNREVDAEEAERGRRLTDLGEQKLAKENARQVSLMVRESSSNKLAGSGPMWLGISRNSMRALEEIERTRRMRDVQGQRVAMEHARAVSNLIIGRQIAPPRPNSAILEEEERQSRILDRQRQQIAIKNARKVSGLVARHMLMSSGSKSFALALEESERSRRLQDNEQQNLARDNARKVSNLVSSLTCAPGNQQATPVKEVPTFSAPIQQAPVAPVQQATLQQVPAVPAQHATVQQAPVAPVQHATIQPAPVVPIQQAPIQRAPIQQAPIQQAPIQQAPIAPIQQQAPAVPLSAAHVAPGSAFGPITPIATYAAPVSAAPTAINVAPTPTPLATSKSTSSIPTQQARSTPTTLPVDAQRSSGEFVRTQSPLVAAAPVTSLPRSASSTQIASSPSVQPLVLPTTSAPIPVAPLASTIPRQPSFTTVPVDPAATSLAPLGDKERSRLMKQVDKHNKKSENNVRKAEKQMLKAEKFHQKGRDDKAQKLEIKAEKLMQEAEHERQWASGIRNELSHNAPAPASM